MEKAGIQKDQESYFEVKSILDKIELRIDKIKNEQSFVFDPYANPDDEGMMKALNFFRNLYYAERSLSSLLIDGYYKNTAEYNSELIKNMGLVEEEVVNLKE